MFTSAKDMIFWLTLQRGIPVFLIWAYHRTSDVDSFEKHEFEGVQSAVILPALPSTAPWPSKSDHVDVGISSINQFLP